MNIIAFIHSRALAIIAGIVAVVATIVAYSVGDIAPFSGSRGLAFASPNLWISSPGLSLALNLVLVIGMAVAVIAMLKTFNIMRTQTALWATFFLVAETSLPDIAGQFSGATLLAFSLVAIMTLMFNCYADPSATRLVFAMFFILGLGAFFQYAFLFYVPALLLGIAQMRIFNLRSLLAAIFGLATPALILLGFGIVGLNDFNTPHFDGTIARLHDPDVFLAVATVVITIGIAVFTLSGNLMKVLSYNAKFRSANGFMAILLIFTILAVLIDFNNMAVYLPSLFCLAAYQEAHFFSSRRYKQSYIPVAAIIALYLGAYIINLAI